MWFGFFYYFYFFIYLLCVYACRIFNREIFFACIWIGYERVFNLFNKGSLNLIIKYNPLFNIIYCWKGKNKILFCNRTSEGIHYQFLRVKLYVWPLFYYLFLIHYYIILFRASFALGFRKEGSIKFCTFQLSQYKGIL